MKRVWQQAAVARLGDGFGVALDGKPVRKPGGAPLVVAFPALAAAIAAEWDRAGLHGGEIAPDDLPLTRLATTAIDRVAPARDSVIGQLAAYGLHDLLCYRAESPAALVARQAALWQPWLDWAAARTGVALRVGAGIAPIAQPPEATTRCSEILAQKTDFDLAGLGVVIPALGSFVLGIACLEGALPPRDAFQLAMLDELHQAEQWGEDADAATRRALILADIELCTRFWGLCR